jgi:hypothetical protein
MPHNARTGRPALDAKIVMEDLEMLRHDGAPDATSIHYPTRIWLRVPFLTSRLTLRS